MEAKQGRLPPDTVEPYKATGDLLEWMSRQFSLHGDIYKASLYGSNTYAIRDPEYAYHVLVVNWQNYVKGRIIERVALLLGNGLMVSEGEFWKQQRRMIQPMFNYESFGPLAKLITAVNLRLLGKWQLAAGKNETINVTRDASAMALEVVLRFIFGEDYEHVGPHFDLLNQEQARTMAFARSFRQLGKYILEAIERRRKDNRPSTDALDMMMHARDPQSGQPMPDSQLIDEVLTMIVAGHETTASTLNWTWHLISQHPGGRTKTVKRT